MDNDDLIELRPELSTEDNNRLIEEELLNDNRQQSKRAHEGRGRGNVFILMQSLWAKY